MFRENKKLLLLSISELKTRIKNMEKQKKNCDYMHEILKSRMDECSYNSFKNTEYFL